MTTQQLQNIQKFCLPFYTKTGKFHAWDHIELVHDWAVKLADSYPKANLLALRAAAYIHDIGRSIKDEGHPDQSVLLAHQFLVDEGISEEEIKLIEEAVSHHDKAKIKQANSIEAKLLFDADKLQIVTVNGFVRCWMWLVDERSMGLAKAGTFLLEYVKDVNANYLFSAEAKKIAQSEIKLIEDVVHKFTSWETKN